MARAWRRSKPWRVEACRRDIARARERDKHRRVGEVRPAAARGVDLAPQTPDSKREVLALVREALRKVDEGVWKRRAVGVAQVQAARLAAAHRDAAKHVCGRRWCHDLKPVALCARGGNSGA